MPDEIGTICRSEIRGMYNKHLDAFMSVVEKGSFSKAAEREGRYPHHRLRLLQQRNHSLRYTTVGELHMFVEKVGISEMDTIVAATSNGAKVLRVYDKTGSLEAGKSADLLSTYGSVYTFAWGQFVAGILMNIIRCQIWKFTMPTTGVIDTPLVLVLAYQLIFGTMISYCIYLVGVTMIGPSRASMLSSIEPVATAVLAAVLLATPLVFMDYVGVVLITICILVLSIPTKAKPVPAPAQPTDS